MIQCLQRLLHQRVAQEDGVVSLEFLVTFFVWFVSVILFINIFFILSSALFIQTSLNRASQQIAAQGCLTNRTRADYVTRQSGLGVTDLEIVARTPDTTSPDFRFNRDSVVTASGSLTGRDASCSSGAANDSDATTTLANGRYIWVRVQYRQRIVLLPGLSPVVDSERTALVLSNSLRSDPPR